MSESHTSASPGETESTASNSATTARQSDGGPHDAPNDPTDDLVTTTHTLHTTSGELHYTARAGRMVLREEVVTEGKFEGHQAKAEVFLTSYTVDGADPGTRPVT